MKFIRRSRVREKMFVFGVRAMMILTTALICLWMISGAQSAELKISKIYEDPVGSSSIVLEFDGALNKEQVELEYDRNFIQVSMKGVSGFPAKFQKLTHPELDRVFSYQYQPGLSRARILLHSPALKWRDSSSWLVSGNSIRLNLTRQSTIEASENKPQPSSLKKVQLQQSVNSIPAKNFSSSDVSPDQNKINFADSKAVANILKEVNGQTMSDQISLASASPGSGVLAGSLGLAKQANEKQNTEDQPLFAGADTHVVSPAALDSKSQGSLVKVIAMLLMIVGVIGASGLGFKKFVLGKVAKSALKAKAIEVIVTQSMGNKKSIAIVRVLDRYLVVGMGADGMNLLQDLGSDPKVSKALDEYNEGTTFTSLFQKTLDPETKESTPTAFHKELVNASQKPSVRSLIKKRLEEFKPL